MTVEADAAAGRAGPGGWTDWALPVLGGVILAGLALYAWRDLLGYDPSASPLARLEGAEGFFFSPADASPRLVFALTGVLLLQRRREILTMGSRWLPDAILGLSLLLPAAAAALWARHVGVPELLVPAFSLALLGAAAVWGGPRALGAAAMPAAFLLLAWRPPAVLVQPLVDLLQVFTAATTSALLGVLGIEAQASGNLIVARGHVFHVIESCAGLRTTLTLLMASAVYLEATGARAARAAAVLLVTPLLGLLINEVRVIALVLNPLSQFATVHTLQGLVMIAAGVLLVAAIDRVLARSVLPGSRAWRRLTLRPGDFAGTARARFVVLAAALAVLALASARVAEWTPPPRGSAFLYRLPFELGEWRGRSLALQRDHLGSVRADEWLSRSYTKDTKDTQGDAEVSLLLAVDLRLDPRTSMLSTRQLLPGPGWRMVWRRPFEAPGDRPGEEFFMVSPRGETRLGWTWTRNVDALPCEVARAALALDRGPTRRPESERARLAVLHTALDPERPERARGRMLELLVLARRDLEQREPGVW